MRAPGTYDQIRGGRAEPLRICQNVLVDTSGMYHEVCPRIYFSQRIIFRRSHRFANIPRWRDAIAPRQSTRRFT
jgi:hypothetical protein